MDWDLLASAASTPAEMALMSNAPASPVRLEPGAWQQWTASSRTAHGVVTSKAAQNQQSSHTGLDALGLAPDSSVGTQACLMAALLR